MRKTKIVATLGPASSEPVMLERLLSAGVDVARLNFSHGVYEQHKKNCENVRAIAQKLKRPIAVLLDLQGPKIRVGKLPSGSVQLVAGETLTIDCAPGANARAGVVPCDHPGLAHDVKPGDPVLLDDGKLRMTVEDITGTEVRCRIVEGGELKERKGINLPSCHVTDTAPTEKDKLDLAFGVKELMVDYLALSFVQSARDVDEAKALAGTVPVIAKIEKPQAVHNLDAIIHTAAGCMVARGDLGVEYPLRRVPVIQKDIIEKVNARGKLVIVATQMLESMIEAASPTRAEVSDVANAVLDGADAVMLSAETASGKHPVLAVRAMADVIEEMEASPRYRALPLPELAQEGSTVTTAVARAAAAAAKQLNLRTIAVYTRSGELARLVSDHRPPSDVYAYTPRPEVHQRLAALWGVRSSLSPEHFRTTDFMVKHITEDLLARGVAHKGETIAIVGPTPPDRSGWGASMLQVAQV
ncbi:MAG: pyruvate kinase [Deltaproteobacteria bacterium]|nr:pyruvate kinase [Deltaproteobacteria bacterium]